MAFLETIVGQGYNYFIRLRDGGFGMAIRDLIKVDGLTGWIYLMEKVLVTSKLYVGNSAAGYTGTAANWMVIDGTNAPTFPEIRLVDAVTGLTKRVYLSNGAVTVES